MGIIEKKNVWVELYIYFKEVVCDLRVMDRNHFERPTQLRVAWESIEDEKGKRWRLNTNQGF